MSERLVSVVVDAGGASQKLTAVTASQQTAAMSAGYALVYATASVFVRQGANPTAVTTGADLYLAGNVHYRLAVTPGSKLAFAASNAADIYITPGA